MFGTLRLLLAATVVLFHSGYRPFDIRVGVSAVVVFFMLSGYIMTALYKARFEKLKNAPHFYAERVIRIFPQYYFYLLAAVLVFYVCNIWLPADAQKPLTVATLASNIMLLPLGLAQYIPALQLPAIIGPTVSLANECLFYLLLPFVVVSRVAAWGLFILSAIVFTLATHGEISMVAYSYNYLPGPMVFLLMGHFLYARKIWVPALAIAVLAVNHLHLATSRLADEGFNNDMYVGLYSGLGALLILKRLKPHKIDDWLGAASYGCFLGHSIWLVILRHYGIFPDDKPAFAATLLALSVATGFLSYYIAERPTLAARRRWRIKCSA